MKNYIFYIIGGPCSYRQQLYLKTLIYACKHCKIAYFTNDYLIKQARSVANIKENNTEKGFERRFYKHLNDIDYLDIYKYTQEKINLAVQKKLNIVINMDNLTYCDRKRWKVPTNYKKIYIDCSESNPEEVFLYKNPEGTYLDNRCYFYYPQSYLSYLSSITTPVDTKIESVDASFKFKEMNCNQWYDFIINLVENKIQLQL